MKSLRCDQLGVSPLKQGGILHSDPKMKANILNIHFMSVFSQEDDSPLPNIGPSLVPLMKQIHVDPPGIAKLLKSLQPHKATRPDELLAQLQKKATDELAPVVSLLFQASFN